MASRSKTWVCGHTLTGITGSNPAGGVDICLSWMLFAVTYRSLWRAVCVIEFDQVQR